VYQESVTDPAKDGQALRLPQENERDIFRAEAREHYIRNQERIELPRLISTRMFRILWLVALLFMAVGTLIAFWPLLGQIG
jgi:hypothetical protein